MSRKRKNKKRLWCRSFVSKKIRTLLKEGYGHKQAVAIALSQARKKGCPIRRRR